MNDETPESVETKFVGELDRVIDYFREEFRITYAQAIGCLRIVTSNMEAECRELSEDD